MLKTPPSSAIVAGVLWAILMLTVGVSSASGANEAVAALPREAVLTYDLKLGGFDVGTAEVAIALPASATTGGPYRIAANITTAGVVSIFTDFHTRASSDGAIADARVRPRRHEVNNVWRGEVRKVTLRYDDATPAPEAQVTPPPDAEDRDPIPVADTVGSVDPLSGILQLVADADSETAPVKIFDGRRLYTLALFDPRPASVDMPGWRGPAVRARLRYERLGGTTRRWDSRKVTTAVVYMAPAAAMGLPVAVPLRVVMPTDGFGGFIIELTGVQQTG